MKTYLVGGALRDRLLGLLVCERDWVVVGASPEDLLRLGYKQVGKDFPVFLHPKTGEEYALARRERKVAPGYAGFLFDTSPEVSLEEDLLRRDLTINAMAETPEGELIDPYRGREDLANKILRHVSPAFAEDPVRILRIARFAARYAERGFTIAPETQALMKEMVSSGEVNALVPERVFREFERALGEKTPAIFFQVLADCGALSLLFPMIQLQGQGMKALKRAAESEYPPLVRFAALMHASSKKEIDTLCKTYRLPVEYRELARLVCGYSTKASQFPELTAEEILDILQALDAFRREERFNHFLKTCQTLEEQSFPGDSWQAVYQLAKQITVRDWLTPELKGPEISEKLREKRLTAIKNYINSR